MCSIITVRFAYEKEGSGWMGKDAATECEHLVRSLNHSKIMHEHRW